MHGFTQSLNVSVATSLVLAALIGAAPGLRGDLIGGEQRAAQLEAKWRAAAARVASHHARKGGAADGQAQQQLGQLQLGGEDDSD